MKELNMMTYEDAIADSERLSVFDVIIFDEAHYLKNHETKKAVVLKSATTGAGKDPADRNAHAEVLHGFIWVDPLRRRHDIK